MQQKLLPLAYIPSFELCDFVVAPCNQVAFDLLHCISQDYLKDKFYCLFGDAGCGKTHLLQGFAKDYGLVYRTANQVATNNPWEWGLSAESILILDDAHKITDDVWWFHLYNFLKEQNKTLIIAATKAPSMWPIKLADWRSRLATFVCAEMTNPDDDTLKRVLEKIWNDKGISVDQNVLEYIIRRIDRNFDALRQWANTLDELSAQTRSPITIPMIQKVFTKAAA